MFRWLNPRPAESRESFEPETSVRAGGRLAEGLEPYFLTSGTWINSDDLEDMVDFTVEIVPLQLPILSVEGG